MLEFKALVLIPLLPLLGAMLAYIVGSRRRSAAGWIATTASFLSFLVVVAAFQALPETGYLEYSVYRWIQVANFSIDFTLRFDQLTAVMGLVVTGVGTLIHLYSIAYMQEDPSSPRFFSYLNLFLFAMLLLVLGGNLLVLFIGWEGVGFCSYLLIGFWHKNIAFAGAGRKAFVVNRIGDAGFLLAIFLCFWNFGTLDFVELNARLAGFSPALYTLIALLLFVGATGKSAQIPLFVWLPDAMAGPTPVSAFIHAATMVTAGVYLMARMNPLFLLSPDAAVVICSVAAATAVVAALVALVQNDIKKVLAYSTVSQLGFMFLAAGCGAYWVAIFHLVTHAFFKACLFLGSGSVIQACHHEQDMRQMGGLGKRMPWTAATYWVATLAIAGVFPFAGYFSKHHILGSLEQSALLPAGSGEMFVLVATFTAILTAFYVTRSAAMTFLGAYRGHAHPHESPWQMVVPLVVLGGLSFAGGWYLDHHALLQQYLSASLPLGHAEHAEGIVSALAHSWPGFLGVIAALLFYTSLRSVPAMLFGLVRPLSQLLLGKFYIDELYGAVVVRPLEALAQVLFRIVDQGAIDGTVNGTAAVVDVSGEALRYSSSGRIRSYGLSMFIGMVFLLFFYLMR